MKFDIDADGILNVTGFDQTNEDNVVECKIEKDQYMLSEDQVRDMIMQSLEYKDIDQAEKDKLTAEIKAKYDMN